MRAVKYGIGIGLTVGIAFLIVEYWAVSNWGDPRLNTGEKVQGLSFAIALVWIEYSSILTFLVLLVNDYFRLQGE